MNEIQQKGSSQWEKHNSTRPIVSLMLSECRTTDIVIWCCLCLHSSASLDEGSSGASVLSGQVQTLLLQSKHSMSDVSNFSCLGHCLRHSSCGAFSLEDAENDLNLSAFTAFFFLLLWRQPEVRSVRFRAKVAWSPACPQSEWRSQEEQVPEKGLSEGMCVHTPRNLWLVKWIFCRTRLIIRLRINSWWFVVYFSLTSIDIKYA